MRRHYLLCGVMKYWDNFAQQKKSALNINIEFFREYFHSLPIAKDITGQFDAFSIFIATFASAKSVI